MKKPLIFIACAMFAIICGCGSTSSYTPIYLYTYAISSDTNGNVYLAGEEGKTVKTVYLRKYDTNGNILWTITTGANFGGSEGIYGLAVDANGYIFASGYATVTGEGTNVWIGKYDSNGSQVWSKTYSGSPEGNDSGKAIAVDTSGNIFVTGTLTITSEGASLWLAKYDNSGNLVWTTTATADTVGNGLAIDTTGNIYVSGDSHVYKFDSNGSAVYSFIAANRPIAIDASDKIYLANSAYSSNSTLTKYNNSQEVWSIAAQSKWDAGVDVAAGNNYIYLAKHVYVSSTYESDTIVKFDTNGELSWETEDLKISYDTTRIAADTSGNIYCESYGQTEYGYGSTTVYIKKVDKNSGTIVWFNVITGSGTLY